MDLLLAICEAIGLAVAVGLGGPLAWLFIAVMASFQAGIDPRGTDWDFIGSDWFIAVLFAANVAAFYQGRRGVRTRVPDAAGAAVLGAIFGAAALAAEGEAAAIGLLLGAPVAVACSLLASGVLEGAQRRSAADADASAGLRLIFGLAAIGVAVLALFVPPVALLVLVPLGFIAAGRRRKAAAKYEGLRVLR